MTSDGKVEGLQAIVSLNAALSNEVREGREVPQREDPEAPPTQRRIANELLDHLSGVGPQKWEMFCFFAKKLNNLI